MPSKAIFFDKDGTLIPDIPYNIDPAKISLNEGVAELLNEVRTKDFKIVIISNQSGIARGFFSEEDLLPVKKKLEELLLNNGSHLSGFYYCPHHPLASEEKYRIECNCRKPMPGMLLQAAKDLDIDLGASWFIGDILNDVEAGNRAGCKTIFLNNGNETEWKEGDFRKPDFTISNIFEAARIIEINSWKKQNVKA